MKIYLSCSKDFFDEVDQIKKQLEVLGHFVTPPNGWNDSKSEALIRQLDKKQYVSWKAEMLRKNIDFVANNDAVLILNFNKNGVKDYIGGSTFLEAFKAFELGRKIFLYNPIPKGSLSDELTGFAPSIINGNLEKIG